MESELSDGNDPDYLPSSGTEESQSEADLKDMSSDTEKGTSSKDEILFSETVADDENEPEVEVRRTKKLVKKNKSSRSTTQKRSVLDFPEDADSNNEIGMCSQII